MVVLAAISFSTPFRQAVCPPSLALLNACENPYELDGLSDGVRLGLDFHTVILRCSFISTDADAQATYAIHPSVLISTRSSCVALLSAPTPTPKQRTPCTQAPEVQMYVSFGWPASRSVLIALWTARNLAMAVFDILRVPTSAPFAPQAARPTLPSRPRSRTARPRSITNAGSFPLQTDRPRRE
jgi:hypothetical protein